MVIDSELQNCNIALRNKNLRVRVSGSALILENLGNGQEVCLEKYANTDEQIEVLYHLQNFAECLDIIM